MSKKILITGGAGFVGRRLVKVMLDKKYNVVVVDNMPLTGMGIDPEKIGHYIVQRTTKTLLFIKKIAENGLKKIHMKNLIMCFILLLWLEVER